MREFQDVFDTLSHDRQGRAGVFPAVNIDEDADNYYVSAELPGLEAQNISIETVQNTLTIGGERTIGQDDKTVSYHRREREAGSFRRSMTFPSAIDGQKVEASYKHGVLTVVLPKAEEAKPRAIQVRSE